jgi:hypothetical protein
MRSAMSAVTSAEATAGGITPTTSAPTSSTASATCRHARSSSALVVPPGWGVPVPRREGRVPGRPTSTETQAGPAPTTPSARRTTLGDADLAPVLRSTTVAESKRLTKRLSKPLLARDLASG